MNKKLILFILLIISFLAINISSAASPSLGTFRQGSPVELLQTCTNITGQCSVCNISSVTAPNSSSVLTNIAMTKRTADFNYTLLPIYTNDFGAYLVNGFCSDGTVVKPWVYRFTITANGSTLTTSQGLIYLVLFILLIATFIFLSFSFMRINPDNMRGEEGQILKINYKKYLRQFVFMMAYVCLIGIMYFAWSISYGLLYFTEMANFFYFMFRILFIGLLVLFPVVTVIGFITLIKDKRIEIKLDRGLTVYG